MAARFCARLVLLHQGAVLADGPPADILQPEMIRRAYGVAAQPYADPITGHLRLAILPIFSLSTSLQNHPQK